MSKYIYITRLPNGDFRPNFENDMKLSKRYKIGETYKIEAPKKSRNYLFHKKMFALLNLGYDNTKLDLPFDTYRNVMTIKAGYFNCYIINGKNYYEAKSISYGKMGQPEFEKLYSRVLDKVIEDIGADKEVIESELMGFL